MGDPHGTSFRTPLESCLRNYVSQNISNENEPALTARVAARHRYDRRATLISQTQNRTQRAIYSFPLNLWPVGLAPRHVDEV